MEKCRRPRAALVVELLLTLPLSEGLPAVFFCFLVALLVGVWATTFGDETSVDAELMEAAGRLMVLRLSAAAEALELLLGMG